MRLYQSLTFTKSSALLIFFLVLTACASPQVQQSDITVTIYVDGTTQVVSVPSGATARDVFEAAGVEVDILDKSEPPLYTVMADGDEVALTRVTEEFVNEDSVIPYETQLLRNESLPEGERRLIQPGINGSLETTYRKVFENGVEVANSVVKTVVIVQPVPEVVMIGSQTAFAALPIEGKLAYISAGNAWIMEETSGIRRPVVTTGDLDGRIFKLSPDGKWLLFTRSEDSEEVINRLWVAQVEGDEDLLIDLEVENVIHFADWVPGSVNGIVFSTADLSPNSPGWQANNDLKFLNFSSSGWVSRPRTAIDPSSGGLYGWWGTTFSWSPDGEEMLYARPDGIGRVDFEEEALRPFFDVITLQTRADWAWVPSIAWAPDGAFLYTVTHSPQEGLSSPEESPLFDLSVIPLTAGAPVTLVKEVGMFANPVPSPAQEAETGENIYKVAFLQALIATQSDTSGYRLVVMDRDGSNRKAVFPPDGAQGLAPQEFAWAPVGESGYNFTIAVIYQGDLWLVNTLTGDAQQLTGDGLTTALDWK